MFQCPTSGFLLFYSNQPQWFSINHIRFNALPRAFFFSTFRNNMMSYVNTCFNALPRAFFFSTLLSGDRKQLLRYLLFQCPTSGFLLFYLWKKQKHFSIRPLCFNALPRAFFFSTYTHILTVADTYLVSMPYLGLSSFLRQAFNGRYSNTVSFQCPTSGFLLFYKLFSLSLTSMKSVSMPYLGLSSFLQGMRSQINSVNIVSMPYLGLSSFLHGNKK